MPDAPEESALSKVRELCNELSARRSIDPEHREEIRGHLEDKLLGYLNGELKITEEDALLLVRAHFGDARGIARQLAGERYSPSPLSTRRRIVLRVAALTAMLTLFGVPICGLLTESGVTTLLQAAIGFAIIVGCLMVLESGVLLAALADLQSRWQRLVAALLLLPVLGILCLALVSGVNAFTVNPGMPFHAADAAVAAIEIGCLTGHLSLLVFMLLPARSPEPAVAGA